MSNDIVPLLALVAIGISLFYGAYTDWKSRTIPNQVPLSILFFGLFTAIPIGTKLLHFSLMVAVLLLTHGAMVLKAFVIRKLRKREVMVLRSGGGDLKLYLSLSFAIGLFSTGVVLLSTALLLFFTRLVLRNRSRESQKSARFPLGTYLASAYCVVILLPALIGGFVV